MFNLLWQEFCFEGFNFVVAKVNSILKLDFTRLCYETIMFGPVTHMLDAAAKRVRSFVLHHSHSVTPTSVVLSYRKRIYVTEKGKPEVVSNGTGPLACLSLFPVAGLDKVS